MQAAGLYQIQITGKTGGTVVFQEAIEQVGAGDIWIFAGQSNAAGYGQYIKGEEVDSSDDDPPEERVNLYLSETLYTEDGTEPQDKVNVYVERFTQIVEELRRDLNDPALPVITVQLNSQTDRNEEQIPAALGYQMREIQRQIVDPRSPVYVPGTAVIAASDLVLCDTIHNSANSNVILAKRAAKAALALAYGEDVPCGQPNLAHAATQGRMIQLDFENGAGGLKTAGTVTDFTTRDKKGRVPIIKTEVCKDQVKLTAGRDFTGNVRVDGLA